jgi:hypothetical protein
MPHFRAIVTTPSEPGTWSFTAGNPAKPCYGGDLLFHGAAFQAITAVHAVTAAGAFAEVIGARVLGWPGEHWRTDPAAVDAALQLALLWGKEVLGGASLPMGVRVVRVHRTGLLAGAGRCVVRATETHHRRATCDVALLDEDGGVRAELLGVSLVLRPSADV